MKTYGDVGRFGIGCVLFCSGVIGFGAAAIPTLLIGAGVFLISISMT